MKNRTIRMLIYGFIFCAASFWFLRYFEYETLFVPYRQLTDTPKSVQLDYEDVTLRTRDRVVIRGWFVPHSSPSLGTLYFLHGNGGNISHRINKILFFHEMGYNVFILDYRGYGQSRGRPSEKGLYLDAITGYDYLEKKRDKSLPLVVFGESLGGAVAIDLASKRKVDALVVEGAFTSMADMVKDMVPLVPTGILAMKFDSIGKIRKMNVPVLFLHSRNDEVVPFKFGKQLYEASMAKKKDFLPLTGSHNVSFFTNQDNLRQRMDAFLVHLQST